MANSIRGEISAEIDGKTWTLCLTLGALANLENAFDVDDLSLLAEKFSSGNLSSTDLIKIIHAGLQGGGNIITEQEVSEMKVPNGLNGYVDITTRLLEATFTPRMAENT